MKKLIRAPAAAGAFYPADKSHLSHGIDCFLSRAKKNESGKKLKILIVPHAGYPFSGQTAVWGFKQAEAGDFNKVILVGCSHRLWLQKAAVFTEGEWQTPLGRAAIDEKLAKKLITNDHLFTVNREAHREEHSLEAELPFLQKVLNNFKFVPILLSRSSSKVIDVMATVIIDSITNNTFNTLMVISSDLSRYPGYKLANEIDKKTIEMIENGNADTFRKWIGQSERGEIAGVQTAACGGAAVELAMVIAKKLKLEAKLIQYQNSGDVSGDKTRVVGYAAIGFYKK